MKFGGSSLASANRIRFVADLIARQPEECGAEPYFVVCSAMGSSTNLLLAAGEAALKGRLEPELQAVRDLHRTACDEVGKVDAQSRTISGDCRWLGWLIDFDTRHILLIPFLQHPPSFSSTCRSLHERM